MKNFSLAELKLADELLFPADAKLLFEKHDPEYGLILYLEYCQHNNSLIETIFAHSRADFERGLSQIFEAVITELLAK